MEVVGYAHRLFKFDIEDAIHATEGKRRLALIAGRSVTNGLTGQPERVPDDARGAEIEWKLRAAQLLRSESRDGTIWWVRTHPGPREETSGAGYRSVPLDLALEPINPEFDHFRSSVRKLIDERLDELGPL